MGKPIFPRNMYGNLYGGAFLDSAVPPVSMEAMIQAAAVAASKSGSTASDPKPLLQAAAAAASNSGSTISDSKPKKKKKKKSKADKVVDEFTSDKISGF